MKTSDHADGRNSAVQCSTRRVYRERNTGTKVFASVLVLLVAVVLVIVRKQGNEPWWPYIIGFGVMAALVAGMLLVWREVTVDGEAQVTREAWRLVGMLTVWRRQRNLREFASVRSQRVEVVHKGDRRTVCDVYLMTGSGPDRRLEIERFEMGRADDCPNAIEVGRDLAQITGLPFEDKC